MRAILKALPAFAFLALAIPSRGQQPDPAQSTPTPIQAPTQPSEPLPDAPGETIVARPLDTPAAPAAPPIDITLGMRFRYEAHTTFGPAAFLVPAASAALVMAHPPDNFPREWSDGGGAFGRNYGAELLRHTTSGLTHFTVAAIDHEDPRYFASTSPHYGTRALHAIAFTVVNRSVSGRRTLALSNFAGATAGGFVSLSVYPDNFNDTSHALKRTGIEFASFVGHNLTAEFAPEISHLLHKLHLPDRVADAVLPDDIHR
jgi:hypothetical protein